MPLVWLAVPTAPSAALVRVTVPFDVLVLPVGGVYWTMIVHDPTAGKRIEPLTQVPPVLVNVPFAPLALAAVGVEASVTVPRVVLLTVIVPEWAVVVPVTREGAGAENVNATLARLVPVSVTGVPVPVQPVSANVSVLL